MRYLMDFELAKIKSESTDVLVIGSGVGGLFLSLKLGVDKKVTVLSKKGFLNSNTYKAQGGIAAVISSQDSKELHFRDTIQAGAGLCDPEAVRVLVDEGPARVMELVAYGVKFDREGGELALTREAAHSSRRILHAQGDATGKEIVERLSPLVLANKDIDYKDGYFAVDLITVGGRCVGALAIDSRSGEPHAFLSKATVLATGGAGQLYRDTTNPEVATGDGIAMAYRAGAELMDMEFIQFHPTVFAPEPDVRFLISEAVRGEGAILRNERGERFMPKYHELAELAPRDVVCRAILMEMENTNSDRVFLDLTHFPLDKIKGRFPTIYETCKRYGVDISRELVPVIPAAHYIMGGVRTDLYGRTNIPGLYACGETACTGVHGANRLASNSLLEALVFGHRISEDIRKGFDAMKTAFEELDFSSVGSSVAERQDPFKDSEEVRRELKEIMTALVGIVRSRAGLEKAREKLAAHDDIFRMSASTPSQFEVLNMLTVSELIVEAALNRGGSVGSHYSIDSSRSDTDSEGTHIILQRQDEKGTTIRKISI